MQLAAEVRVDPAFSAQVDEALIQRVACQALMEERGSPCPARAAPEPDGPVELTVVVTDDSGIRELNRRYRGIDSPTDVLAFGGEAEGFVEAPEAECYLGDVVVSYPRVQDQASEHGHSPQRELALLVAHGVLHLLGYDHATPDEEAVMWRRQDQVLERLGDV